MNLKRSNDEYSIPSCADLLRLNKAKCQTELTEDRTIEYFNFGRGTGYWKSEHMAIQFEDLNNILDAVPRFSYFHRIFLFDWSSGHAKALEDDGLKTGDTGMNYGGVQTKMRKSILCMDQSETVKAGW